MPWIALAVIGGSLYTADQARKANNSARDQQALALQQQSADAARMREELAKQTAVYQQQAGSLQQQADIAKQTFEASQASYAQNKLAMDQKAKEVQAAADEERRKAAQQEASALRARTRGGRRSLLSDARMDAELGVPASLGGTAGMV